MDAGCISYKMTTCGAESSLPRLQPRLFSSNSSEDSVTGLCIYSL